MESWGSDTRAPKTDRVNADLKSSCFPSLVLGLQQPRQMLHAVPPTLSLAWMIAAAGEQKGHKKITKDFFVDFPAPSDP